MALTGMHGVQNLSRTRQKVESGKEEANPELQWTYKSMAQWQ